MRRLITIWRKKSSPEGSESSNAGQQELIVTLYDSTVQLRPLGSGDEQEALAAHHELRSDDFDFLFDCNPKIDWNQYLQILAEQAQGKNLPADRVPATFLVATVENQITGRVSIRHYLNEYLAGTGGGHIGYAVRPEFRRKGMVEFMKTQRFIPVTAD